MLRGSRVRGVRGIDAERRQRQAARAANPRFVLQQWVLEEVIRKVLNGKRVLRQVLQMACNPYGPWDAEDDDAGENSLDLEITETLL
ncbi:hypothetical protein OBBRIDRAFT_837492 [Obba rivulosa]|uniref:Uncharacterized protein n=1 Tax=Obba rivulosa TaxID=1052685 RepID=A0A8E2DHT7_9APHY|nr:hypothetical protein OBBRIDRAFT_837492 [Obba rivulosa]